MRTELPSKKTNESLTEFHFEHLFKISSYNGIDLLQYSDVQYDHSTTVPPQHKQWCDEITYVYGGQGTILHNGRTLEISSGQIHLCKKDDMHQIFNDKGGTLRFYCIGYQLFPENPLYQLAEQVREELGQSKNPIINDTWELRTAFEHALFTLYDQENKQLSEHIAVSSLNYILSVILNGYLGNRNRKTKNIYSKENLLFQIMGYLKSNIYDIDALKKISAEFGYSYSHLSHFFSEVTGKNLKEYFTSLRMEAARSLLMENTRVTQVSELLGYSSIHTFSRAYKAYFQVPPSNPK
ncbi:MAG: helix-turn-helix domain-containing protein [Clostridia bacterium]|nr:helix-turn-helix domain-containing protein [Clostridia bacterium]